MSMTLLAHIRSSYLSVVSTVVERLDATGIVLALAKHTQQVSFCSSSTTNQNKELPTRDQSYLVTSSSRTNGGTFCQDTRGATFMRRGRHIDG
jgi:hypothetical protein